MAPLVLDLRPALRQGLHASLTFVMPSRQMWPVPWAPCPVPAVHPAAGGQALGLPVRSAEEPGAAGGC